MGIPGRLFAIIWVLTGLVIISIFTGLITTALTVTTLNTDVKLYGTTVSAYIMTSGLSQSQYAITSLEQALLIGMLRNTIHGYKCLIFENLIRALCDH